MPNIITYNQFLFEADSVSTQISNTKLELSKLKDEYKASRIKMEEAMKGAAGNKGAQLQAESVAAGEQAQIYGKMIPLLNTLKSQLDKRITELKG